MRKMIFSLSITFLFFLFTSTFSKANSLYKGDSIEMGADYANDVYYSLSQGEVAKEDRFTWDIAFRTNIMSSSILINGGSGVMLYTYPNGDTSSWMTVDTSGLFGWKAMNNHIKDWELGAFSAYAGIHPDYGWANYNSTTHNLIADSFFIIQLADQSFRKLWIIKKESSKNKYHFRYAMLDGSMDAVFVLDCNNYITKDFVAFSISDEAVNDRQPAKTEWDLLFTKYVDKVFMGPSPVDYPVMGILTNQGVHVARVSGQEESTYEDYMLEEFDSTSKSVIGRDWKKSAGMPPTFSMVDSLLYFVSDVNGAIYRLYFTDFVSGSTGLGKVVFNTKNLGGTSVYDTEGIKQAELLIYPNPASAGNLNLVLHSKENADIKLDLFDVLGQTVYSNTFEKNEGLSTIKLNSVSLEKGSYIARIQLNDQIIVQQFIIQ